jgi:orotidine-5'-phosphate decarboxylase
MAAHSSARERLAFALDFPEIEAARPIAAMVAPHAGVLKVGLELFIRSGSAATRLAAEVGCALFLDLKLHDIPETVERAVANACQLDARYLTLHASGGSRMLSRAVERVAKEGSNLEILAVTVLTSLDADDLLSMGIAGGTATQVLRLAQLAWSAGVRGFVCSPADAGHLRDALGPKAVLVTPGIRPSGPGSDDQKRIGTPRDAIRAGSNLLVVGRPIRDAGNPQAAAFEIESEIARALQAP